MAAQALRLSRLGALAAALLLAACTAAPYTQRSQLILIDPGEEQKLGAAAFKEVVAKSKIDGSPRVVDPVKQVGERIARVANKPEYRWQFVVIDDDKTPNAFCLPGGKVAVYTGIFPIAKSTAGLAVVMGHEIAHALARHGAERASQTMLAQMGGQVLGAATGSSAVMQAYGVGAQVGLLLPWSRTQESEADHIGLILMAKAGYDPREAVAFWERMERADRAATTEFLSTHPGSETRVKQIEEWLLEVIPLYEEAKRAPVEPLPPIALATTR